MNAECSDILSELESWYSRDTVPCIKDRSALRKVLTEPGRVFLITNKRISRYFTPEPGFKTARW